MSAAWGRSSLQESARCVKEAGRHGSRALQCISAAVNPPATFHPVYKGDVNRFVEDNVRCAAFAAESAAHYAHMAGYGR